MSPEREREYAELHAFLDFYSTNVKSIDPANPIHPTNVGKEIVQQFGKSKALEGLRQAINDTVEELSGKSAEFISRLDANLRAAGILTVSEVRRRYASSYKRIVKRGIIRTETEYYLVNGIVSDVSNFATKEERTVLQRLLHAYEQGA